MNSYNHYSGQQYFDPNAQYEYYGGEQQGGFGYFGQQDANEPSRQPWERRVSALERENQQQARELNRLNREVNNLQQTVERHTRRLNRLNQRLRAVENRLNIPFFPVDGF